jgi:hypothetical protein
MGCTAELNTGFIQCAVESGFPHMCVWKSGMNECSLLEVATYFQWR